MTVFLIRYWRIIVEAILVIISIVVLLLKKKPTINEIDNILRWILENLPQFINQVESTGLPGSDKKEAVVYSVIQLVKERFSFKLSDSMIGLISDYIEKILSTPQKKEVSI